MRSSFFGRSVRTYNKSSVTIIMSLQITNLVLSPTQYEGSHHLLGSGDTLLGQQADLLVTLDLEDGTERVQRIRKSVGEDEVHQ
jgi:hypothetical protein